MVVEFAQGRAVYAKALGGGKPAKAGGGSRCPELRRPSEGVGAAGAQANAVFLRLLPDFPEQLLLGDESAEDKQLGPSRILSLRMRLQQLFLG